MGARGITQLLARPPAEILAHLAPDDPRFEGALYVELTPDRPVTAEAIAAEARTGRYAGWPDREARLRAYLTAAAIERHHRMISGGTLCSQARTPFTLDGVEYPSVRQFYDALKVPDGELRARFLAGASRQELGTGRGRVTATFSYRGEALAVGGRGHLQLIARAVSAKVAAHASVRGELRATGRLRLTMGADQALGRVMPFALMVERLHL